MKVSNWIKLFLIVLLVVTIAGCSAKNTQPAENPINLDVPSNLTSLILINNNDNWQSETTDGLYGYSPTGWSNIENIFSTNVRYCKPWDAGFVLTFNESQDSFFYIAIYNADTTDKILYINTYDNKTPPYNWKNVLQQEIKSDTAKKYQIIKVNMASNDFYDTENRDGIQQKFSIYATDSNGVGVDSIKVAYIGNPGNKPELLFSNVIIQDSKLIVDVSNIGLTYAENVIVKVYDINDQELTTQTITLLNPNTTKELIFENISNVASIKIDPDNVIDEIIEENNQYILPQ